MLEREFVYQRVDRRATLHLVSHAEAEIQDEGQTTPAGVVRRVIHCSQHAPGDRNAATGIVGDLEAQQLRSGRHAIEAAQAEHVMSGGDPGDV